MSVPAIGYSAQSGPQSPVPVASLTKITTAVVILRDHPLAPGEQGPVITVTSDDVAQYDLELHQDQSTVAIEVGEQLTERQALEAMLTQSANDVAYTLAVWDAGSVDAFVVKMNALAASLGTTDTHYVDASGYDPATVSSASDVLRVAAVGMAIPTFAEIVGLTQVTLPLAGTLHNIVAQIGVGGVIGVKSGYTSQAGACMVLAADRVIDGRTLLVLVAVTGQPTPPPTAPTTTTTTRPPGTTTTTTRPPGTTTTTTTLPLDDEPVVDPFKYAGTHDHGAPDGHPGRDLAGDGGHPGERRRNGDVDLGRHRPPGDVRVGHRRLATGLAGPGGAVDDHVHHRPARERGRHTGGLDDLRRRQPIPGGAPPAARDGAGTLTVVAPALRRSGNLAHDVDDDGSELSTATSTSGPTTSTTAAPTPG